MGRLVRASSVLPTAVTRATFARAGGAEAVGPDKLTDVSAERFSEWVVGEYPWRHASAVAIGSSNGAMVHLCAALGIPWLPQTFLVPVARRADPHEPAVQVSFAAEQAHALLDREPGVQIHHMHDPNQDALMIAHLAYFRMKQRQLTSAYQTFIEEVLLPGGQLIIVDCEQQWPTTRLADRYVFQPGAVGGLTPEDYLDGSPHVARFLDEQGATQRRWHFPQTDGWTPEAEWGYEPALTDEVCAFAEQRGYRVMQLRFPKAESLSPLVADIYGQWYDANHATPTALLAETFISVEPHWVLNRPAVPLWLVFPVERSAALLERYLEQQPALDEVLVTLFANGIRSAGQAPAERWRDIAERAGGTGSLVGVDAGRWPADFATLACYSAALHRQWPARHPPAEPMSLEWALSRIAEGSGRHDVECKQLL